MRTRYDGAMPNAHALAELTWSLHQPWRASVGECLARWRALDRDARARSYLVLHGEGGTRQTLTADRIAELDGALKGRVAPTPFSTGLHC